MQTASSETRLCSHSPSRTATRRHGHVRAHIKVAAKRDPFERFDILFALGNPESRPSGCRSLTCSLSRRGTVSFEQRSAIIDPEVDSLPCHSRERHAGNLSDDFVASINGVDESESRLSWNRWDWAAGYGPCTECPDGYWMEVQGVLPKELTGTYFRWRTALI